VYLEASRFEDEVATFVITKDRKGDATMSVSVNEIIRKLSPAERKNVQGRADEIIAEEMSLRDLRKARDCYMPRSRTSTARSLPSAKLANINLKRGLFLDPLSPPKASARQPEEHRGETLRCNFPEGYSSSWRWDRLGRDFCRSRDLA
jgi:hypothetical protein